MGHIKKKKSELQHCLPRTEFTMQSTHTSPLDMKKDKLELKTNSISDTGSDSLPYWFGVLLPRIGEYGLPNEEVFKSLHIYVLLLSF